MKVIAINGSPHRNGNTHFALATIGEEISAAGIDFEILHIGGETISSCSGCGKCFRLKNNTCGMHSDIVNATIPKILEADGVVIASPVHYSGMSGAMKCYLDRVWYVSTANNNSLFRHKVGAAAVAVRRSGGSATLDSLYHYLSYSEMMIATSNYWNIIHGAKPGDSADDAEGVQIMRVLGKNMAWMLKMREIAAVQGLDSPVVEQKIMTNFIR
ncbi:MAG: flavodoxin family protein [Mangrovibacterium sp.]